MRVNDQGSLRRFFGSTLLLSQHALPLPSCYRLFIPIQRLTRIADSIGREIGAHTLALGGAHSAIIAQFLRLPFKESAGASHELQAVLELPAIFFYFQERTTPSGSEWSHGNRQVTVHRNSHRRQYKPMSRNPQHVCMCLCMHVFVYACLCLEIP